MYGFCLQKNGACQIPMFLKINIYIPSQNITFIRANDMGEQLGFTNPSVYIKTVFRSGYKIVSGEY